MAQLAQIIDLTKSYYPCDPNAFPENMIDTQREDSPEKMAAPVIPYEGWNFLPTSYGYRSYFGKNSKLNIDALASPCDHLLLYQDALYNNVLVALCDDGVWVARTDIAGINWVHEKTLTEPAEGSYLQWTWCVLANDLYIYRQGHTKIFKLDSSPTVNSTNPYPVISVTSCVIDAQGTAQSSTAYKVHVSTIDNINYAGTGTKVVSIPIMMTESLVTDRGAGSTWDINITWADFPAVRENDGAGAYGVWFRVYFQNLNTDQVYYTDVRAPVDNVLPNNTMQIPNVPYPTTLLSSGFPDAASINTVVDTAVSEFTPSFLTMTAQMGVFRAGSRLGMWDSSNSISWSSLEDYTDFTPDVISMSGNMTFIGVIGRIVVCHGHSDGFIIYSTGSILGVRQTFDDSMLWDAMTITNKTGVFSPKSVTLGRSDSEQFAYTHSGLYTIGDFNKLSKSYGFERIFVDITDFLDQTNLPIHIKIVNNRYLFLNLLDNDYVDGLTSNQAYFVPPASKLLIGGTIWDGNLETLPTDISGYQWSIILEQLINGDTTNIYNQIINDSTIYTGDPSHIYEPIWVMYDENNNIVTP